MKIARNWLREATFCLVVAFALVTVVEAQTNTFPTTGNVGIGTMSPDAPLTVSTGANTLVELTSGATSSVLYVTSHAGWHNWQVGAGAFGVNGFNFVDQSQGVSRVTIDNSGKVGIGTTTPSATLEVDSNEGGNSLAQGVVFTAVDTGINNSVTFHSKGNVGVEADRALINAVGNGASVFYARGDGNVGIGTTNPQAKLDVNGSINLSGSGASITFPNGGGTQTAAWTGSLCGGDYAESVDVTGDRTKYEPGDVLIIDPDVSGKFLKSAEPYSTAVTGIYSTKPGVLGRRQSNPKTPDEVPMAMIGIVPTKVSAENGPIHRGDLLVTSSSIGYAMKGTDRSRLTGAVIGKALENLESGKGTIEVVVTLQ